jgi:hypothetical protein
MENTPSFYMFALLFGFFFQLISLLGSRFDRELVDKVIMVWGEKNTWRLYLVIAVLASIYLAGVTIMVLMYSSFSLLILTIVLLVLWALISTWALALKRIPGKWIGPAVDYTAAGLLLLTAAGFWIGQWPQVGFAVIITLLLLATVTIIIVLERKRRKLSTD